MASNTILIDFAAVVGNGERQKRFAGKIDPKRLNFDNCGEV
jgi:hypothetical protein